MPKPMSFKNFTTVEYRPGEDELTNYRVQKRRKMNGTGGPAEEAEAELEALNFSQRRARARQMRKMKARLKVGRARQSKKAADLPRLKKRARKHAMNQVFKKLSKGKSRSEVPPARRQEIEKRLEKMKGRIDRIAMRNLPSIRKLDKERRSSSK